MTDSNQSSFAIKPDTPRGIKPVATGWKYMCEICKLVYDDFSNAQDCLDQHLKQQSQNAKFKIGQIVADKFRDPQYLIIGHTISKSRTPAYEVLRFTYKTRVGYLCLIP